ncbi:MAG TPA: di-trans,poly-cis-decaprenylcistransferase [Bryobacteraceae bacterium]|nr:di-trans,poly-cis-decaprenylcistransferase [Bryobacteraceae bacterium]
MPANFTDQSTLHAAIVMDGNGRWASARFLPRLAGHRAGASAVRRTVEACPDLGIGILTLYAFSSDNWRRPPDEVGALMDLMGSYLASETARLMENGVRLEVIGRRDRLQPDLIHAIERAETATAGGCRLRLRIAVDYSARDQILRAAALAASNGGLSRESLSRHLGPEVDLLIRTGGEKRLSDFLLWECAYAELVFSPRMWPDFDAADLAAAVRDFRSRERRFGGLPVPAPARNGALARWLE